MRHDEVLDLLQEVMVEHNPQWVFEVEATTRVICSCGDRVRYSDHIKDLMQERMTTMTKDGKSK